MDALLDYRHQPLDYHRKRPRWYYSLMIDWMMANPGGDLGDLAKHVGKTRGTVSAIIRSDMFQAALAQRKREYSAQQDELIRGRLTKVALASLDTILEVIDKKKGSLPLETLSNVSNGALQKLGYGAEPRGGGTAVQVNVTNGSASIQAPISAAELEDARTVLRQHQAQIAAAPPSQLTAARGPDAATDVVDIAFEEVPYKGAAPGEEEA